MKNIIKESDTYIEKNLVKKEILKKDIYKDMLKIAFPTILAIIFELFFDIFNGGFYSILRTNVNSMFFSVLIFNLLYAFLISIIKKSSVTIIILSVVGMFFLIINQIKIIYTGNVIVFSDINFLNNVGSLLNLISGDLIYILKAYILKLSFFIISFLLIMKLSKKNDFTLNNLKLRIICITTSIIILFILFIPNKYTKNIFLNIIVNSNNGSYTTQLSYCDNYSLLAGIYGILLNDRFYEPEDYNEEELNIILQNANEFEEDKTWGKPNIIVVFSESFWDIDKQNDVEFNKLVAPNIKRLKQEGKLIETLSCAYGRLSENIAFELLTGASLNYFNDGYIPIMSLYKKENSEKNPSILKELKENNYRTKIVFGEDYYNSEEAMEKIGFDEYIDVETPESVENPNNISDEYLTNLIIEELKNKNENERIFYMTETIQNHMPYKLEKYNNYDISITKSCLTEEENNTILSYAQGVYDADKQLNILYEYVKQYDEPTIIIFLGDHLPNLTTEKGKNALESISYFNTGSEIEDIYRKYNTQTLILSNYEIDTTKMPNCLSNDMILTYIVNHLDIELSPYYKWLYSTINVLPASNSYISLDIDEKKYKTGELTDDMEKINRLRKNMQYMLFIKSLN